MTPLDANDPTSLNEQRYTLLGILGEGAMGRTYLAEDTQTGTRLAIKALYPSRLATIKDLEMFQREASVLQRLEHPQIPAYLDAFHEGEGDSMCYFLAQTYVEGKTLRAIIDSGKRFDDDEFIRLAEQLLEVLSYLHTSDPPVVHRDVKPANIIIHPSGLPTIVDFGAVREVVRLTMGGGSTIIGTYGYMPPEQLMGRSLPATDVYALGVTLVECLTRQTPNDLHGEDIKRLIASVGGSDNLKRLLSRMCAPSLEDRFVTASDVLEDLRGLKGGVLVHTLRLEQEMILREKERAQALKRSSSQRTHVGYVMIVLFAVSITLVAVFYVAQAVVVGLNTSVQIALLIGAAGLFMNIGLIGVRVAHDAWEAPQPDWIKAKAKVISSQREQYINDNGILEFRHALVYQVPVGGALRQFTRYLSLKDVARLEQERDRTEVPRRIAAFTDFVVNAFAEEHNIDLRKDSQAMARLANEIDLKKFDQDVERDRSLVFYVPKLAEGKDFRRQITYEDYKKIVPISAAIPVGYEFHVWYPPGRPEHHDLQDIRQPGSDAMGQLFTHKVIHTPE